MTVVAVFADGGVVQKNPSTIAGTWCFCHVNDDDERVHAMAGLVYPQEVGGPVTNNQTEFMALLRGLEELPDGWEGWAYSDSWVTLQRFFLSAQLKNIPHPWRVRMGAVLRRLGPITHVLLDGHPTQAQLADGHGKRGHPVSSHNVFCDQECTRLAHRLAEAVAHLVETLEEPDVQPSPLPGGAPFDGGFPYVSPGRRVNGGEGALG